MANTYRILNLAGGGGGSDDRRVKVSIDDSTADFLEGKIGAGSSKVLVSTDTPGGDETVQIDVDEAQIDHDALLNYDITQHRALDDASTTTTSLWSSDKIQTELDSKINAATPMTDNKLVKSIGTSGVDVEATGIDVDDSNNITGVNDLTIDGNLTVNGTTTSVNSDTLDVVDANITVNVGGDKSSANAGNAGITVELSGIPDVAIGYDSSVESRMVLGSIGTQSEVITSNHTQTITNKSIDADSNIVSNLELDNLKAGVLQTDISGAVSDTNIASSQAIKTHITNQLALQDDASEITFTPVDLADWDGGVDPGNTNDALDQLADRVNNGSGSLSAHLDGGAAKHTATSITNAPAGNIAATTVQAAIDELDSEKYTATSFDGDFDTRLGTKDTDDLLEGSSNLYFTEARAHIEVDDIANTSFTFANNIAVAADITGLLFNAVSTRSFSAHISIVRSGDSLFEEYEVTGINTGSDFFIMVDSVGNDSGVELSITSSGQLQYTSSNLTAGGLIRFRAKVNSI